MRPAGTAFAIIAAALVLGGARPLVRNWNTTVTVTPSGSHVLGNPHAGVKLTQWVSYTCPHCSHFEQQSESALRVGFVASGKVSVEVANYVRDPVDLAAALLARCGPPSGFFLRHTAFLRSQPRWIERYERAGAIERQRWMSGVFSTRMRAIASDFGFYAIAASRGVDRRMADRCLSDESQARLLSSMLADAEKAGVQGTPSFAINGVLLAGTHEWRTLEPQLNARM